MIGPDSVCQLKITLRGTRPSVWRRLLVRADTTLFRLHGIVQVAMGWTDSHLHQFHAEGQRFGVVEPGMDPDMRSDRRVVLLQVAPRVRSSIVYEYDFGDSWMHDIRVESDFDAIDGLPTPVCLDGGMACPPEDCGGDRGYAELVKAISKPTHSRHEELVAWLGRPFDPAAFDRDAVNVRLARSQRSEQAARRNVYRSRSARRPDPESVG